MKKNSNSFALSNVLDKEFEKMMFPLHLMQLILLQPKYRIIRGAVKKHSIFSHVLCLLGVACVALTNFARIFYGNFEFLHLTEFLFNMTIMDGIFYSMSGVILWLVNIYQSKNNVLLFIKIQNAYRIIATNEDVKNYINLSWLYFIFIILVYIFIYFGYFQLGLTTVYTLYTLCLIYFDGNAVFAIHIIKLLVHELKLWISEMNRFLATCSETNHNQLTKYLNEIRTREERLLKAYMDIIEAFNLCGKIFRVQILLQAAEIFVHPLIYVQTFIEISKTTNHFASFPYVTTIAVLISIVFVIKNLTLLVCVCVASQQFYMAVADVDAASAIACSQDECLADVRRLCKNVRRVNACAGAGRGLRAGGALAVDAALPLRLLALLATYTVVLLQFAFL